MSIIKNMLVLSFILVIFTTCTKDKTPPIQYSETFGIASFAEAQEVLKSYVRWGIYTDGVSTLRLNHIINQQTTGEIFHKYRATLNQDRSDGGDFYINDLKNVYGDNGNYIPELDGLSGDAFEVGAYLKDNFFGKNANFRLEKGAETIYNETIYIPEAIQISNFTNTGIFEQSTYHQISRDNFSIEWNTDSENDQGILLLLTWDGHLNSTLLSEITGGGYYYKARWLEDSGNQNIPSSFFAEVPEDAIFSLSLWRSNIEIIKGTDDKTYKIYGISKDKKNCLLTD